MDAYSLKSVSDLPGHFRSLFGFRYFNPLQSECFPVCFHSDVNMVISAPTGSGKTVLFELCILRLLSRFISDQTFVHIKGTLKTVYIAPSKALVQEKHRDWTQKFGTVGVTCLELTGDNEFYDTRAINEADIILTTPEKFDAVTRYRIKNGGLSFFSDIALLLIDEVHLLNDPRGAALEAIVSRIKMLARNPELKSSPLSSIRLLAVSATVPNICDLGKLCTNNSAIFILYTYDIMQQRMIFSLKRQVGLRMSSEEFERLQNYIFDILMQFSRGKSALVFCSTRKGAQETAQKLSQTVMSFGYSNPFIKDHEQQERLREASMSCSDRQMQSYILYGIGYHNGGLCMKDRNLVESLFLRGDVQILCATNTLAHGVNLPAHTVIIKSTQHYNKEKGLYMEYDRSMILQMCGRAGRPPFDDTGMVVIMTKRETVHLYENLLSGCEMVESQLLSCVTEHLTAEIVQLTVSDIARAIEWLKCSFLYVRMKKNPENYPVSKDINRESIEKHIKDICVRKVQELSRYQMILTDDDGFLLKPLEPGRLMTKYYLKFDTMKHIMLTPENCSLEDALKVICHAEEISWIQLRRNEKKILNDINADKGGRLRFHVNDEKGKRKKRIQSKEEKIFILANDCLTGDPSIRDLSLSQDMNSVCTNGNRIAKCMKEYFLFKRNYKGAVQSILLAKSLYQKLWDDSPYLLKQLPGIGMVTAKVSFFCICLKALDSMGVKSFNALAEADPRRIEIITGRKFPFGNHIKDSLLSLPPKVDISIEEIDCQRQGKTRIKVTLTRLSQSSISSKRHYADMRKILRNMNYVWLQIVGIEEENLINFHEKISRVDEFSSPYSAIVLVSVNQQQKLTVKADFMFEEYLGLDSHEKLVLTKEIKPDKNSRHGRKQPSYVPPSEKVCLIEDDDETMSNGATEDSSLPSFKLIDNDLEEGATEEGEPGMETENDKGDNHNYELSERTIFDHIREKAKNFPFLNTSNSISTVSSEAFCFPSEGGPKENQLDHNRKLEGGEDGIIDLTVDPSWSEQDEEVFNSHSFTDEVGHLIHLLEDEGGCCRSEPDQKALNGESIFDHIRRKAEEYPAIPTSFQAEHLMWGNKRSSPEPCSVNVTDLQAGQDHQDGTKKGSNTISEVDRGREGPKVKRDVCCRSPAGTLAGLSSTKKKNSPAVSKMNNNSDNGGPVEMLSFDISMMKDSTNSCSRRKEEEVLSPSGNGSKRQRCLVTVPEQTRDADSFMGFQSVFSFL
ncbi:DExH-box ATP-dependent RNA helicase DExH17 [Linum perenne]